MQLIIMFRPIGLLLMAGVFSGVWAAGVYKWVDEQGNVHFGDRPPMEDAEEIDVPHTPSPQLPDESGREHTRKRLLDMYDEDRARKKQAAARQKQERLAQAKECSRARDRLRFYERTSSLYDTGPDGERQYLSEAERDQAIAALHGELCE